MRFLLDAVAGEMGVDWNVLETGDWGGVMLSKNGGESWEMTSFPANFYVTSILFSSKETLLVSARSHFFDKNNGGIWMQQGGGAWRQVWTKPVFNMLRISEEMILAGMPYEEKAIIASSDGGHT